MGPKLGNDSQLQQNLAKFSDLCSLRSMGWGSLNAWTSFIYMSFKHFCLNPLYQTSLYFPSGLVGLKIIAWTSITVCSWTWGRAEIIRILHYGEEPCLIFRRNFERVIESFYIRIFWLKNQPMPIGFSWPRIGSTKPWQWNKVYCHSLLTFNIHGPDGSQRYNMYVYLIYVSRPELSVCAK